MIWSTWFGQFTFDRLLTLIYPLYHYAQYIEQHQLYFGQSTLKVNLKVPRSIWHTTRAASLHLFYLVLFGLNLAWNAGLDKPVLFLDRSYHFPKPIRDQILIGCSVACIMSLLVAIFGLSTRLSDYRFTAVLLVKSHRDSCAIITDHNLEFYQYSRFNQIRQKLLSLLHLAVFGMPLLTILVVNIWAYLNGLWHSYPILALAWILLDLQWLLGGHSVISGLPVFLLISVYYLWLKQQVLFDKMNKLNDSVADTLSKMSIGQQNRKNYRLLRLRNFTWREFLAINHQYTRLQREVATYNGDIVQRLLSILLSGYVVMVAYTAYIVLLSDTPPLFRPVFALILATFVGLLLVLMLSCAQIAKMHRIFANQMRRFYHLTANIYNPYVLLQIDYITQSVLRGKSGFRLVDNTRVNSNLLFLISYYISVVFFMACKRN